jgi:hypothetical protein
MGDRLTDAPRATHHNRNLAVQFHCNTSKIFSMVQTVQAVQAVQNVQIVRTSPVIPEEAGIQRY